MLASYNERSFFIRGNKITLQAGQLAKSEEDLAERWKWSRNTVRRFLNEQQECGNIEQQKSRLITIITVKFGIDVKQQIEHQTDPNSEQQIAQQFEQQIEQLTRIIDNNNKQIKELQKEKEELKKEILKKEKEEEKEEKQNYSELEKTFDDFRRRYKEYGGKVRGLDAELDNLKKKHKDWKEVIPLLMPSLEKENEARMQANIKREFFPPMKNLQTYINNRSWECYLDEDSKYDGNEYRPLVDGIMQRWDAKRKRLLFNGYLSMLNDGYTPDNRPDGATIEHSLDTWVWSAILRDWIKQ